MILRRSLQKFDRRERKKQKKRAEQEDKRERKKRMEQEDSREILTAGKTSQKAGRMELF